MPIINFVILFFLLVLFSSLHGGISHGYGFVHLAGKNDQEPALQELQTFTDLSY
jgi:hypothetical protein